MGGWSLEGHGRLMCELVLSLIGTPPRRCPDYVTTRFSCIERAVCHCYHVHVLGLGFA